MWGVNLCECQNHHKKKNMQKWEMSKTLQNITKETNTCQEINIKLQKQAEWKDY